MSCVGIKYYTYRHTSQILFNKSDESNDFWHPTWSTEIRKTYSVITTTRTNAQMIHTYRYNELCGWSKELRITHQVKSNSLQFTGVVLRYWWNDFVKRYGLQINWLWFPNTPCRLPFYHYEFLQDYQESSIPPLPCGLDLDYYVSYITEKYTSRNCYLLLNPSSKLHRNSNVVKMTHVKILPDEYFVRVAMC